MGKESDTSREVTLQRFSDEDIDRLLSWVGDEPAAFLLQWAGPVFTHPLDERQLREHLAETRKSEPTRLAYLALDADGRTVGYVELNDVDRENGSASISRVLVAPDERDRGSGRRW